MEDLDQINNQEFIRVWDQFFIKGRIIYNVSHRWLVILEYETQTFRKLPTPGVLVTSGEAMETIHWEIVNKYLEDIPEKHIPAYTEYIMTHAIRGGLATIYLKERLLKKLGKPLKIEFYNPSALIIETNDWKFIAGIKNRDADRITKALYLLDMISNTFKKYPTHSKG